SSSPHSARSRARLPVTVSRPSQAASLPSVPNTILIHWRWRPASFCGLAVARKTAPAMTSRETAVMAARRIGKSSVTSPLKGARRIVPEQFTSPLLGLRADYIKELLEAVPVRRHPHGDPTGIELAQDPVLRGGLKKTFGDAG